MVRIYSILIGVVGLLLSLLALHVDFLLGIHLIPLDIRLATILGISVSTCYLISNIGIMMLKKNAIKLNLITAFPCVVLMLYVALSPKMAMNEYLTFSIFGKIAVRNPGLFIGLVIFSIYYVPSIMFLNEPRVKEQFR